MRHSTPSYLLNKMKDTVVIALLIKAKTGNNSNGQTKCSNLIPVEYYLYSGTQLITKMKQIIDIWNNMNVSQNHYTKQKKTTRKGYILYDSIQKTFQKMTTHL